MKLKVLDTTSLLSSLLGIAFVISDPRSQSWVLFSAVSLAFALYSYARTVKAGDSNSLIPSICIVVSVLGCIFGFLCVAAWWLSTKDGAGV